MIASIDNRDCNVCAVQGSSGVQSSKAGSDYDDTGLSPCFCFDRHPHHVLAGSDPAMDHQTGFNFFQEPFSLA
jgi:hypothetical protein